MSAPYELSIPPHLWLKLLPDGPLYLALSGDPSTQTLEALLQRPEIASLAGRTSVALLDLAHLHSASPVHDALLAAFAQRLVDAGCRRVAAATSRPRLAARIQSLSPRPGGALQSAAFDQSAAASQWLFSSLPAPPSNPIPTVDPHPAPPVAPPAQPAQPARAVQPAPSPAPRPLPPPVDSLPQAPLRAEQPLSSIALTEAPSLAPQPAFGAPAPPPPGSHAVSTSFAPTVPDVPHFSPASAPPAPPAPPPALSPPALSALSRPSASTTKPSAQPLESLAPRLDRLLPLLLPRSTGQAALGRSLLKGAASGPWLTAASGEPPRRFVLLREPGSSGELLEEVLAESVVNLERMDIPYEIRTPPWGRFARSISAHAAEGVLSPRLMARLQADLGAKALAVAIPVRGGLMATRADDAASTAGLRAMAKKIFDEAGELGLTADIYLLEGGLLRGLLPEEAGVEAGAGEAPRPLPARTLAEAHLYMDLRGARARNRAGRVDKTDAGPVHVFDAQSRDGDRPMRFDFTVDDPAAPPRSYGGPGPSRIIAPDEFMMLADVFSKQVPASPDGLGAGERLDAKRTLEDAAAFLHEVIRFIPHGSDRVPEQPMKLRDRWESLHITAGRFDRARLEVVAKVYSDIAAKF